MRPSIAGWLAAIGLQKYASAFAAADIDLDVLAELDEEDLEKLGVSLGDRKRIMRELRSAEPRGESPTVVPSDGDSAGERRQITVLFCDLVGSTALATRLDPEDLRSIISAYHGACAEVVTAHDGDVAQFLGDGVMAEFGYPRAHEDDAERAVRCALAMIDAVRALRLPGGVCLQTRVGIATGTEVVGDQRGASRDRASVVGATPSLAARLQGVAEPETVVLGTATRRLLSKNFALTSLGDHPIKGFEAPIPLWRVDGEVFGTSRFAAQHLSIESAFVGREVEIALLAGRLRSAERGEGQAIVIGADAGVGKSRIVEELVARASASGTLVVRLQGVQHFAGSALYPVRAALEHAAGIVPTDGAGERYEKLRALDASAPESTGVTDGLALLLALPGADALPAVRALSVEQRKAFVFAEIAARLAAFARSRPVLAIAEDLHWIDPTTLELIAQVIAGLRRQRVLLVATARPEFTSPWAHHGNVTALTLNRLGSGAVQEMIEQMSHGKPLPEALVARIVERADGVPLFVEELTKTILASARVDDRDVVIPETLRDALAARLDSLAAVREIAQVGAVIGRDFSESFVAAVTGADPADLRAAFDELVRSGLVLRNETANGTEFSFKHALVRDAAYDSLLRPRRQQLHRRAAKAIVTQFAATADAVPELVAQHLEEGGAAAEALPYWTRAGIAAISRSAYREAAAHLSRALVLHPHASGDGGATELDLRNRLGVVYFVLEGGTSATAREIYERACALAANLPESAATFAALWGLCFCDYMSGRTQLAGQKSVEMIALAERLGNDDLMLEALHASWAVAFMIGDVRSVLETTARGVAIYKRERHHAHVTKFGTGHDSGVCGWGHGAMALILAGRIDEGRRWLAELKTLVGELDHQFSQCVGMIHAAVAHDLLGEYQASFDHATEWSNVATSRKFGMPAALGSLIASGAQLHCGDRAGGIAALERIFDGAASAAPANWRPSYLARLGLAEFSPGALARVERAEASVRDLGGCYAEPEIYRSKAELLHALGEPWQAIARELDRAAARAREDGSLLLELRATTDRVKLAPPEALDEVALASARIRTILERISGDDAEDVRRARAVLERLERREEYDGPSTR